MSSDQHRQLRRLAIALPLMYACHLVEESWPTRPFNQWLDAHMGAHLSTMDFILINAVAMSLVIGMAILYLWIRKVVYPLIAITTVFTINGWLHLLTSVLTLSYAPGTITGALLYLPLGWWAWHHIRHDLSPLEIRLGILAGILIHVIIVVLALNL